MDQCLLGQFFLVIFVSLRNYNGADSIIKYLTTFIISTQQPDLHQLTRTKWIIWKRHNIYGLSIVPHYPKGQMSSECGDILYLIIIITKKWVLYFSRISQPERTVRVQVWGQQSNLSAATIYNIALRVMYVLQRSSLFLYPSAIIWKSFSSREHKLS